VVVHYQVSALIAWRGNCVITALRRLILPIENPSRIQMDGRDGGNVEPTPDERFNEKALSLAC
jgi:hypothetical protein